MSKASEWVAANAARPRWREGGQEYIGEISASVGDSGALKLDERGGCCITLPAHEALALAHWILETFK
jgi:hypothetical protein